MRYLLEYLNIQYIFETNNKLYIIIEIEIRNK